MKKKSTFNKPSDLSQTKYVDQTVLIGTGGETHENSLKIGEKGPALLEDMVLRQKIFSFRS